MEDFSNMISVLNLPSTVADVSVREQFSVCGPVHWTSIVAPGCALVRFATPDSAQKAISTFNGGTWAGQSLQVQPFTLQPALLTAMPKPANDNQMVDLSHAVDSPTSFTLPAGHAASPMNGSPDMADLVQCSPMWSSSPEDCQGMESTGTPQHGAVPGEVINSADTEVAYDSTLGVWRSPRRDGRSEGWEANSPETWTSAPMPTPATHKTVPRPSREDLARMAARSGYPAVQGANNQQWSPQPQSPNAAYQTPLMFEEPYSRTPSTQGYDPQAPRMSCDGQGVRSKSEADRLRLMKMQSNTPPGTPKSHEQSPAAMLPQHVPFNQADMVSRMNSNVTPITMYRGPSGTFTPVSPMYAAGPGRVSMPNTPTMRNMPSYTEYLKDNDLANMLTSLQLHHQPTPQRQNSAADKPPPDVPAHLMSMLQNSRLADVVANAPPGTDIMSLVASAELGGNSPMSPTKAASRTPSESWNSQFSPAFPTNPNANLSPMLSGQVLQEFTNTRGVLVQLMLNAYQMLGSENVAMFTDKLARISQLYDEMHELPVVQKRKKCADMAVLKNQLMQDTWFVNMLQTLCTFRNHMYSLSRKILFMNNGPEGVPIDLFLGSMSSDVYHLLKANLPPEICEFFTNSVPNPRLALLVFCEFTTVDPAPVAPLTSMEGLASA